MKQRTYSDIKPKKNFSIENIENGRCTVLFFDDVKEEKQEMNIENKEKSEKVVYSYYIYSIEVAYRDNLEETIEANYDKWLKDIKEKDINELATQIRKKRDELLYATDKYTILDYPITEKDREVILEYRQKLRDIPQQENFPYSVEFPDKPNIEVIKTMKI
nr:MAG TPA: tail assembly chaperone protein [Caudoviricetes sp.]